MALDVSELVSDFGAFYKPGSDNEKNLRNMIYQTPGLASIFRLMPTEDTIYRGSLATLTRIVQPFQKTFTPIGTTTFQPNKFDLFKLKIDMKETPDDLEATYVGFLAALPEADRSQWPFSRWIVENHILPKKDEDLSLYEHFKGEYAAPTPGTAGAAGTAMNGVRKNIRGYNTDGRTNLGNGAIATGAAASDDVDFCTQMEEFVASIPDRFRMKLREVCVSPELELKYKRGKRKKYNQYYAQANDLMTLEDFPNVIVKGFIEQSGSDLIWTTIPENRIRPVKKISQHNAIQAKEFSPREVSFYTDWWESLNFEVPEFIFHNDQDLV